jgi:predicted DNA-binding ribbon-helix-helix protein
MKSMVIKRSIIRDGHKSSVSLEDQFWDGLREIAGRENMTVSTLVGKIDQNSNRYNLSSAIRVFVFNDFRARTSAGIRLRSPHRDTPTTSATPVTRV